jgi:hypothetical protein
MGVIYIKLIKSTKFKAFYVIMMSKVKIQPQGWIEYVVKIIVELT